MKYYSEVTKELYDSEDELRADENAAIEAEKLRKEQVENHKAELEEKRKLNEEKQQQLIEKVQEFNKLFNEIFHELFEDSVDIFTLFF